MENLVPSYELDKQIEIYVMENPDFIAQKISPGSPMNPPDPRPFSSNIAVAWQVVEKMRKNFKIDITTLQDVGFSCHVRLWNQPNERDLHVDGKSAPHAICLAALQAVNHK